jgi:hypothetical protein
VSGARNEQTDALLLGQDGQCIVDAGVDVENERYLLIAHGPSIGARMRRVTITFEDAWHRRLPAPEELPGLLPNIDNATPDDRQVAVYAPPTLGTAEARNEPPASLDGLADKPWIESVVLGWRAQAHVALPGVRSLIGLHMFSDVDGPALAHLPNLEQLVQSRALPADVAHLARLRDAIFDWPTYIYPPDVSAGWVLSANQEEREPYRVSPGAEALSGLRSLERLRIDGSHLDEGVDPIAELSGLRWLDLHGWRNLRALGRLTELESLQMLEVDMTNLRALRGLVSLRELSLLGRLKSLDGIESMNALEDVWLRGRVVRDTTPLASLGNLRRLTLMYPDAVEDFTPLGECTSLRYLELTLGDDTEPGRLPSLSFVSSLLELEEVALLNVELGDSSLELLFELPRLRRLHLTGAAGPNVDELRRRRPDLEVEAFFLGEPDGRVYVGPVHYDPPGDGIEQWIIFQSLADLLGTETNQEAEELIRAELRRRDPALLERLQFDSEAGAVGIYAASEDSIRAAADVIAGLAQGRDTHVAE